VDLPRVPSQSATPRSKVPSRSPALRKSGRGHLNGAEKLQRVLFNLIQNAIRHTPADGSVTVRARPAGKGVEVEVDDSGEGIPAADASHVFEAFYRGDASRNDDGAGLGLAISKAIIEAHGGKIWLEPGEPGTTVRFTLQGV